MCSKQYMIGVQTQMGLREGKLSIFWQQLPPQAIFSLVGHDNKLFLVEQHDDTFTFKGKLRSLWADEDCRLTIKLADESLSGMLYTGKANMAVSGSVDHHDNRQVGYEHEQ